MAELKVKDRTKVGFEITRNKRKRTIIEAPQPKKAHDLNYYAEFIIDVWPYFYVNPQRQGIIGTIKNDRGLNKYPCNWLRVAFTSIFCYKAKNGYLLKDIFKNISTVSGVTIFALLLQEHRQNLILQAELKREREKYIKLNN